MTQLRITIILACVAAVVCGAIAVYASAAPPPRVHRSSGSTEALRYLGVYEPDSPESYTGIDDFALAVGRQPNLVTYYSPWLEPFQVRFAGTAEQHGAVTLVQIDPKNVPLESIASGKFDGYLRSYAGAVKAFGHQVVLSFGHEMNGNWYSWAYQHTPAAVFVAAWRHVVDVFRSVGATNVTWLWTVNIIDWSIPIPGPAPWWPGSAYVNWVGIDGYYYQSSWSFASLFGPTIVAVRALTHDPILLAETGVAPQADQSAKITDLFAGAHTYGLLGLVWFDDDSGQDWRLTSLAAFAAFRRNAEEFMSRRPHQPSPRPPT